MYHDGVSQYITDLKLSENGNIYLIMKSGRKILYDDGKSKALKKKYLILIWRHDGTYLPLEKLIN